MPLPTPARSAHAKSTGSGLPGTPSAIAAVHTVAESWPTTATAHAEAWRDTSPPTKSESP